MKHPTDGKILRISGLNAQDRPKLRKFTLVDGSFDPIHDGHIHYFEQAAVIGNQIACLIAPEKYTSKKHATLLPVDVRAKVLLSLRMIDLVIVSELETVEMISILEPAVFFKGGDWSGRLPSNIVEACEKSGTRILFGEVPTNSSSRILENFLEQIKQSYK